MISERIKELFNFIDFLNDNKSTFLSQNDLVNELRNLRSDQDNLRPIDNYKKRRESDKLQKEIVTKWGLLRESLLDGLFNKIAELNIYDWNDLTYLYNSTMGEIGRLKMEFEDSDIEIILDHKRKYIHFRTETRCTYFQNMFFSDLDEVLKELFDFFKDTSDDEFKSFDNNFEARDLVEAVEKIKKGDKVVSMQLSYLLTNGDSEKSLFRSKNLISGDTNDLQAEIERKPHQKITAKQLAIFHKIRQQIGKEPKFDTNEGSFDKKKLKREAVDKYGQLAGKEGEAFYVQYKELGLELTNIPEPNRNKDILLYLAKKDTETRQAILSLIPPEK